MKQCNRLCFCLIAMFLAKSGLAEEKFLVLTEQVYPLNYTEHGLDDEKIKGFAADLVRLTFEEAGIGYEMNMVPWSRAISIARSRKNVVIFSMLRTSEREDQYQWIGGIYPMRVSLYGLWFAV